MDQAKANFERAIARNPKNCRAYTGLVALDNFKADAGFEATSCWASSFEACTTFVWLTR